MPRLSWYSVLLAVLFLFSSAVIAQGPAVLLYQNDGTAANDNLGVFVSSAGDVNGDGRADYIIGASNSDPSGLSNAGSAYVYSGLNGSLLYQKNGAAAGDQLGISVASAGDVNGDGRADFIIGASNSDPGGLSAAGSAYVYSGANGSLIYQKNGAAPGDFLGSSVASAGDVNGDGRADFIIGAFGADPGGLSFAGSAYIYSGVNGSLLYQKNGAATFDLLGQSVASAGDANGDGRADFIIGAPFADSGGLTDAGFAYLYSGSTGILLHQKNGTAAGDNLGISVASAGDVDEDGRADFVIGAFGASPGGLSLAGSAYVFSGDDGSLIYQKDGTAAGDALGESVASAGDVNGDGSADFIIGAPKADPDGFTDAGSAYLYSGATGALLYRKDGAADGDSLGISVASAGDVNGDGKDEFIIGAYLADPNGLNNAGSTFLLHYGYLEKILSITDVGNDQGKQIRLRWRSLPVGDPLVNQFAIFRRQDATLARSTSPPTVDWANTLPPGNWDFVTTVPAFGDTIYQTAVQSLVDSTSGTGVQYSVFFVRAATDIPTMYFDSPIDSGYSVDNLVPSAPSVLAAIGTCQGSVKLSYSNPVDPDFQYFKIYRDTSASFSNPVVAGSSIDSFFTDAPAPVGKTLYYRVRAVDFNGNEGNPSPQANGSAGLKGDLNADAGRSPSDVVLELNAVFLGNPFPAPFCAADLNCDSNLSPADVVLELNLVFLGTPVNCTP